MLPVIRDNLVSASITAGPVNRLDTLFDRLLGDDGFPGRAWAGVPMAMWHDDDHIYIEVEMPGVAEQDVDMTVHNGVLTIRGERKPDEGRRFLYNGRPHGRFERVITLPEAVEADGARASLADGVLSVTFPKSPEAKPRKIALQATN